MPKISVIFVTNRDERVLDILLENMERQTFKDFDVIIADDHISFSKYAGAVTRGWQLFAPRQKNEGDAWNLNRSYNDCLDKARGELLVFLQDFIKIPDDGLQKFWDMYQAHPNALVTGVGHKAKNGLEGISERDRRVDFEGVPTYVHWEMNWASCPRKIMPRFNEMMDRYYGGENQYVAKYAMHMGAEIIIDKTNECIGYSQKECGGRPANWEPLHCNKEGRLAAFLEYLEQTLPPLKS